MSREQRLAGQTLVVIGGCSGIGLETARRARKEGARVILTARDLDRLHRAGLELEASVAAFDANDFDRLEKFFHELPTPIDHVLVTGPGPYYAPLADFDFERARRDVDAHLLLPLHVARNAASKVRPGGTLLFMGGTGGRRPAPGLSLISALTAALPAMTIPGADCSGSPLGILTSWCRRKAPPVSHRGALSATDVPRAPAWSQRAIEEQMPRGAQNSPDAPAPPDDPPPPLGGLPPLR
jgi:NAD(P)-dependent dehydrogenase (short-subunit alcohol dehydrogenase family)